MLLERKGVMILKAVPASIRYAVAGGIGPFYPLPEGGKI